MDIGSLFCEIDDCCQYFEPQWGHQLLTAGKPQRRRASRLCPSETIEITFRPVGIPNVQGLLSVLRHAPLTVGLSAVREFHPLCGTDTESPDSPPCLSLVPEREKLKVKRQGFIKRHLTDALLWKSENRFFGLYQQKRFARIRAYRIIVNR